MNADEKQLMDFLEKLNNMYKKNSVMSLTVSIFETTAGKMIAIATDKSLVLLEFLGRTNLDKELVKTQKLLQGRYVMGENQIIVQVRQELQAYFKGNLQVFTLPFKTFGTAFQEKVWHVLQQIPYGETIAYKDLAERVGQPTASRAVANANGKNQLAIIIPCHRVIRENGDLGGYGGGIDKKIALLQLEKNNRSSE